MTLLAVAVGDLVEVVWVSLVAGVAVTTSFSFVVLGSARSAELRRAGRSGPAMAFGGVALLAFLCFAAVVAYGVNVMLSKG